MSNMTLFYAIAVTNSSSTSVKCLFQFVLYIYFYINLCKMSNVRSKWSNYYIAGYIVG